MRKIRLKKFSLSLIILVTVFIIDRLTKLHILNLADVKDTMNIYVTSYLNLYLIWNKGIAFGLFSMNESIVYNFRGNDILNGGQGAPLTPIFHHLVSIQKKIRLPVCFLNIGGISNITIVKENNNLYELISKDSNIKSYKNRGNDIKIRRYDGLK